MRILPCGDNRKILPTGAEAPGVDEMTNTQILIESWTCAERADWHLMRAQEHRKAGRSTFLIGWCEGRAEAFSEMANYLNQRAG